MFTASFFFPHFLFLTSHAIGNLRFKFWPLKPLSIAFPSPIFISLLATRTILLKVSLSYQNEPAPPENQTLWSRASPPSWGIPLGSRISSVQLHKWKSRRITESFAEGRRSSQVTGGYGEERNWSAGHILSLENLDRVPPIVNFQPLKEASFTLPPHVSRARIQ